MRIQRRVLSGRAVLGAVGVGLIAFLVVAAANIRVHASDVATMNAIVRANDLRKPGSQLVLIYFGSARCVWCRNPAVPGLLSAIGDSVASISSQRHQRHTTVGVAVDASVHEGLEHLDKVFAFNEVATGNGWLNGLAQRYFWERYGTPAATPQVLVIQREIAMESGDGLGSAFRFENERLLVRKVGLDEIRRWVHAGVPVPVAMKVASP